ncbi:MAG: hypothetical protein QNJ45_17355 [Ardenticatenaceae bacterium]|nr:hypothetical protein [Ardenticatenaceae bacterium]
MGRTVKTTNLILQQEKAAFNNFRRTLRRADQALFDNLFAYASKHTAAISMATHALPLEAMLIAVFIEQERKILRLEEELKVLANS